MQLLHLDASPAGRRAGAGPALRRPQPARRRTDRVARPEGGHRRSGPGSRARCRCLRRGRGSRRPSRCSPLSVRRSTRSRRQDGGGAAHTTPSGRDRGRGDPAVPAAHANRDRRSRRAHHGVARRPRLDRAGDAAAGLPGGVAERARHRDAGARRRGVRLHLGTGCRSAGLPARQRVRMAVPAVAGAAPAVAALSDRRCEVRPPATEEPPCVPTRRMSPRSAAR